VRIALLSDIHANREACEACLADAARRGAERLVLLGDLVGYGGDPVWAVERARDLASAGAILLKGNHDEAAVADRRGMTSDAAAAAAWTRGVLDAEAKHFLAALPLTVEEEDRLYVHAGAAQPDRWDYVRNAEDARRSLEAVEARIVLCGHVHVPALYGLTATAKLVPFRPVADVPVPLAAPRRWLAVLGAVGQPRDRNPAAAYAMLDTSTSAFVMHRVPYDIAGAMARIRAAGLPDWLALRLAQGV
jgi:diadenosine tetraphosphatase ApaH/serine/threonine PP2A family protein phosphatase